jgi:hypothetical protein
MKDVGITAALRTLYRRHTVHNNLYPVPESFAVAAQVKHVDYERMYA